MARKSLSTIKSELVVIDFFSMINTEMKQRNITRCMLADRMKCSSANITQIFQKKSITTTTMVAISNALGLEVNLEYVVQKNMITINLEHRTNSKGKAHVVMHLGKVNDDE